MKLAEALIRRKAVQQNVEQLRSRLVKVAIGRVAHGRMLPESITPLAV